MAAALLLCSLAAAQPDGRRTHAAGLDLMGAGSGPRPHGLTTGEPAAVARVEIGGARRNISDALWGIFFEDLQGAVDGGMYAELVKNRDMAVPGPPDLLGAEEKGHHGPPPGWEAHGAATVKRSSEAPLNPNNTHCLQITATAAGGGARNSGYWGMIVRAGAAYKLSFFARAKSKPSASEMVTPPSLRVSLLSADQITPIGSADFDLSAHSLGGWARYSGTLTATETTSEAELLVALTAPGEVCVDVVSLFPPDAVQGLFRRDLFETLRALEPSFMRFPGGDYTDTWHWEETLGPEERRSGHGQSTDVSAATVGL